MVARPEQGLCVEVAEDASRVLVRLDADHAAQLASIISTLSVNSGGQESWLRLARRSRGEGWLGTLLGLMACSQNLQSGSRPMMRQR